MTRLEIVRLAYSLSKKDMMKIIGIKSYEAYNRIEKNNGLMKAGQLINLMSHFGNMAFVSKYLFGEIGEMHEQVEKQH